MQEQVTLLSINAITSNSILIVNSFWTRTTINSKEPFQMILNVALNKINAGSDCCEFPVYIPAQNNYNSTEHLQMLELFRAGVPWVPVECQNLNIYKKLNKDHYDYFAYADSFKVVDYSQI